MKFDNAKKLVGALIALSMAACIGGLVFYEQGSREMEYCALAGFILLASAVGAALKWGRCPWCGKRLMLGMYSRTVCPACRRDLATGKKKKGKGGKK